MTPWNLWEPLFVVLVLGVALGVLGTKAYGCLAERVDVDVRWKP